MFACVLFYCKISFYVTILLTLENKSLNLKRFWVKLTGCKQGKALLLNAIKIIFFTTVVMLLFSRKYMMVSKNDDLEPVINGQPLFSWRNNGPDNNGR